METAYEIALSQKQLVHSKYPVIREDKRTSKLVILWFDDVFSDSLKLVRNRFAWYIFGTTNLQFISQAREQTYSYEFDGKFVSDVLNSFYSQKRKSLTRQCEFGTYIKLD